MRIIEIVRRAGLSRPLSSYSKIIVCDFEYYTGDGTEPIHPHCMVAIELHHDAGGWRTHRVHKYDRQQLLRMKRPPFDIGPDVLYVGYALAAEMSCHQVLGWARPANLLDLFAEHRAETNGVVKPSKHRKNNMLVACEMRGVPTIDPARKKALQVMAGERKYLTDAEMAELIEYCLSDVVTTVALLQKMQPTIDLPAALCRGLFGWPVAAMQATGVPVDAPLWDRLSHNWGAVRELLVAALDRHGFYDGDSFRRKRCTQWMDLQGIRYQRDPQSGQAMLDENALRDLAGLYPSVRPLAHLRALMGKMRQLELTIGVDGMNRFAVLPFNTVTGRNSPSNSRCIFGVSKWLRHLIRCPPGYVLIYFDWSSQEYVIAAALSGCEALMEDCRPGRDPYIRFGQRAGMLPADATKKTHREERTRLKVTALATLYCARARSTALRLGIPEHRAESLLSNHARLYPELYDWQRRYVSGGMACGLVWTSLRWPMAVHAGTKTTTLFNFPCQGLGAEMMRATAVRAIDEGLQLCAPVHDAFLVMAPLEQASRVVEHMTTIMEEVALRLCGFPIKVDHQPIYPGQRWIEDDPDIRGMRDLVLSCLSRAETASGARVLTCA